MLLFVHNAHLKKGRRWGIVREIDQPFSNFISRFLFQLDSPIELFKDIIEIVYN